jgi:hypothetical protein
MVEREDLREVNALIAGISINTKVCKISQLSTSMVSTT